MSALFHLPSPLISAMEITLASESVGCSAVGVQIGQGCEHRGDVGGVHMVVLIDIA